MAVVPPAVGAPQSIRTGVEAASGCSVRVADSACIVELDVEDDVANANFASSLCIVKLSNEVVPPREKVPTAPSTTVPLYRRLSTSWPFRLTFTVVSFSVTDSVLSPASSVRDTAMSTTQPDLAV